MKASQQTQSPREMLMADEVAVILRVSRSTLQGMIKRGEFLPGVYVSGNRQIWFADEIAEWQRGLRKRRKGYKPPRRGRLGAIEKMREETARKAASEPATS